MLPMMIVRLYYDVIILTLLQHKSNTLFPDNGDCIVVSFFFVPAAFCLQVVFRSNGTACKFSSSKIFEINFRLKVDTHNSSVVLTTKKENFVC